MGCTTTMANDSSKTPVAALGGAPPAIEREGKGQFVLVIEDDADCLDALVDVLAYDGYTVNTACNGLEAIQKLESEATPDVILVDLMMPVMNGWQFMKRLRADERFKNIPVIVLSADGRLDKWRGELDAASCLAKPLELEPLLAAVSHVLQTRANPAAQPV
jgi:two-component system, chemotaxis family, chemotaxis protein CheY